jgi:hypothetical protein
MSLEPVLVTFSDLRLKHSAKRLIRQAKRIGVFSQLISLDESGLDKKFRDKHIDILRPGVRGFGFWIWKPQIIIQALRSMKDGQILLYLDVGCHLNHRGVTRLHEYFEIVSKSKSGILAFDFSYEGVIDHKELEWTKSDTLDFFGALSNEEIKQSAQIQATIILVEKRESTIKFVENWLNLMETHRNFIDDTPSVIPNDPNFIENRHDQSVFSILAKLEEITILSHAENFPRRKTIFAEAPAWRDLKFMPIQARRDKSRFRDRILERIAIVIKVLMNVKIIQKLKSF